MIETMNETNIYAQQEALQRILTRLNGTARNVEAANIYT